MFYEVPIHGYVSLQTYRIILKMLAKLSDMCHMTGIGPGSSPTVSSTPYRQSWKSWISSLTSPTSSLASMPRLDLDGATYVVYGVKYIDPVSLASFTASGPVTHTLLAPCSHLDLIRAPYVWHGVEYIDPVPQHSVPRLQ